METTGLENTALENEELERALFDDRDNPEPWQVFGDWLQSQGDPRGEMITRSFAGDEAALVKWVQERERSWLGEWLDDTKMAKVEWRHGFMHHATIAADKGSLGSAHEHALRLLLDAPVTRFLHALTIENYIANTDDTGIVPIMRKVELPGLRHLDVGEVRGAPSRRDSVQEFLEMFPRLWSLRAAGLSARPIVHDELRSLSLSVRPSTSQTVGAAALPKLERLEIRCADVGFNASEPKDIAPLFSTERCPRLKHLALRSHPRASSFITCLAASTLLPQLQTLSLRGGLITRRGARQLIADRDAFAHLEVLDLRDTEETSTTTAYLKERLSVAGELRIGGVSDWVPF